MGIFKRLLKAGRVIALSVSLLASSQAFAETNLEQDLNNILDTAVHNKQIVGGVLTVAQDGKIIYQYAVGYSDLESKRRMKHNDVFRFSAMTKPIIAATALALIEQGKLDLEDPISKWLPGFEPKLRNGEVPIITIRQLLTHTAGFDYSFFESSDGPYQKASISSGLAEPGLSMEEELKRIQSVPLLYIPGAAWNYSVAYDVLGAVIEKASGQSLPDTVQTYVTAPLDMRQTRFYAESDDALVTPYRSEKPEPVKMSDNTLLPFGSGAGILLSPSRAYDKTSYPSGGAGMIGNADDYVHFLEALRTSDKRILHPDSTQMMFTNQINSMPLKIKDENWGFSFGASILKHANKATPQSEGTIEWGGVYGHSWFVDPKKRLTVVLLTNTAIVGMSGELPDSIRDTVYKDLP